jgi:hypothetical protein
MISPSTQYLIHYFNFPENGERGIIEHRTNAAGQERPSEDGRG